MRKPSAEPSWTSHAAAMDLFYQMMSQDNSASPMSDTGSSSNKPTKRRNKTSKGSTKKSPLDDRASLPPQPSSKRRASEALPAQGTASHNDVFPGRAFNLEMQGHAKESFKRACSGQQKTMDVQASLAPQPRHEQKTSEAFSDQQTIQDIRDVIASSTINLEEEQELLFSGHKADRRVSEISYKAEEDENKLLLNRIPLHKKLGEKLAKFGLENLSDDVEPCLSQCVEQRLRHLISSLIRVSKEGVHSYMSRHNIVVTSGERDQILVTNKKIREKWLRNQNVTGNSAEVAVHNEIPKCKKSDMKKAEVKRNITAANAAVQNAIGNTMLLRWQAMAQLHQSQKCEDANARNFRSAPENEQDNAALSGLNLATPEVSRSISVKDVIAVLERDPQMAKSTLIYQLHLRNQNAW